MSAIASAPSPIPVPHDVVVLPGPALLAGLPDGPSLAAHRTRYGEVPHVQLETLLDLVGRVGVRGRGGAAFPFATKLATTARRGRPVVVVNLAEGEPASAKDSALALTRPHLVLDGAVATARALGARAVHLVLPGDRPGTSSAMERAVAEREDRIRICVHTASAGFVAGQARAVLELMSGRPNLPVTAWQPEAASGHRGNPTLLSNAETWAQVGLLLLGGATAYRRLGTPVEPGTTLLTLSRPDGPPEVHEVAFGTRWSDVVRPQPDDREILVGGFHGTWVRWDTLSGLTVSPAAMTSAGTPLGAGVVHVPGPTTCPLVLTSAVLDYLAGQSAGRCGPCLNGLPAMARELRGVLHGHGSPTRVQHLAQLVTRRGACAHPDGTARLVDSALRVLGAEVDAHQHGHCRVDDTQEVAS
jgi:NADH:ubiquinone oxidoreductase subunit F (NADH-binding)